MLRYVPGGIRLGEIKKPSFLGQPVEASSSVPFAPPAPPILPASDQDVGLVAAGLGLGVLGLIGVALSAGGTWVGIHTGIKEKGFLSFTGWTFGIVSALSGLATVAGIIGLGIVASEVRKPSFGPIA